MLRSAVLATLCLLLAAPGIARALPLVFDFEDGFQGWGPAGSAQRVQTQLLGGQWTIFGDGFLPGSASISMFVDLTDIGLITLEEFFVDGEGNGPGLVAGNVFPQSVLNAGILPFDPLGTGNPGVLGVDVSQLTGFQDIAIIWGGGFIEGPRGASVALAPIVSFIDNVTFHPLPEPGALLLLALAALGLRSSRSRS